MKELYILTRKLLHGNAMAEMFHFRNIAKYKYHKAPDLFSSWHYEEISNSRLGVTLRW